jgi:hypothetical protein
LFDAGAAAPEMEVLSVSGLDELVHTLGVRKGDEGNVYILFCGDVSKDTGESWCPDCVRGDNKN